jgi:TatD DNase family protein
MLIDTHAHLDDEKFNMDRAEVIERAFASGVKKIINVGAGLGSSRRSVALAGKHANIFAVVGLHPHYFNEYAERSFDKIEEFKELARQKKVVAIGEIGLDYYGHLEDLITEAQKENQKKGFILQIELARELQLPVIIHCRDAYVDTLEVIKNYPEVKFVFHCYGGSLSFTEKLLQMENIHFSFAGNITYAKPDSEILSVVKIIPLERIMLETDCPYLTPVPHRGKRNEPAFVNFVAEKIAEIKNLTVDEISEITTQNALDFFNF